MPPRRFEWDFGNTARAASRSYTLGAVPREEAAQQGRGHATLFPPLRQPP